MELTQHYLPAVLLRTALFVLALALLALSPAMPPAHGAGPTDPDRAGAVRAQIGDWQIVCSSPPDGTKPGCALVQSVTAEDRADVGLIVYFQKFADGTKELRVFTSLGVLLVPGLGLKIDDVDIGHSDFERCFPHGCYAKVETPDDVVSKLRTGKTAVFIIFQVKEVGIGIPISLRGFSAALTQLDVIQAQLK